jgi:hypothetical protein
MDQESNPAIINFSLIRSAKPLRTHGPENEQGDAVGKL